MRITVCFEQFPGRGNARHRSMLIALEDLHLDHLWVVSPGDQAYDLDDKISVIPVADLTRMSSLIG